MRPIEALTSLLLLACVIAPALAAQSASERGRIDYVLHCSGCHALDGTGVETKGIPQVKGRIGYFLRFPEGRAFLLQVPGLLAAGLSDERAAGVTNWMIEYFAGPSRPPEFIPYTAEEARRYRLSKPADIPGVRQALETKLREAGYPTP
jgi:hypothetical protein